MEFHVTGFPPYKQTPVDGVEKGHQVERARLLSEAASRSSQQLEGRVALAIRYKRKAGRSDAANIIGGIADTLQGICYVNDSQLKEIHYTEEAGDEDEYWVVVEER